jgi:hypothetical protein
MVQVIKVGLVLAVAVIVYFVIKSPPENKSAPHFGLTGSESTEKRIENEIDSLRNKMSGGPFATRKNFYAEINDRIKEYHKYNLLGKTPSDNDKERDRLIKDLYYAYVDWFNGEARAVFRGSDWKKGDLDFIRKEYQTLRKSKLLVKGDPVDNFFDTVQTTISDYDKIDRFIADCNSAVFSISGFKEKISKMNEYQDKKRYGAVNHCTRLKNGLEGIPQVLFRRHVGYLDGKIGKSSGKYPEYTSSKEYTAGLFKPLMNEIDSLKYANNNIYKVDASDFNREYDNLTLKWRKDDRAADDYFELPNTVAKYLKGNELNVNTLIDYKNKLENYRNKEGIDDLKTNIQLCLEFWGLDGSDGKTYESLRYKINNNDAFVNSKLKAFLEYVQRYEASPSYGIDYKRSGLMRR